MDSTELNQTWLDICTKVKSYNNIDPSQINAFFSRLQPQAMSEDFLMLTADNDFIKIWIERHYADYIKQALLDLYHVPFTVVIEVDITALQQNQETNAQIAINDTSTSTNALDILQTNEPNKNAINEAENGFQKNMLDSNKSSKDAMRPQKELQITSNNEIFEGELENSDIQTNRDFSGSLPFKTSHTLDKKNDDSQYYSKANDSYPFNYMDEDDLTSILNNEKIFSPIKPLSNTLGYNVPELDGPTSTLTFENFVIGDSNRMAYSMALAVAEMPGKAHLNPLFIYGKSGLGKTHLLRAIQNYINETMPRLTTIYIDSAELLSDYMEASAAHDKEKSSYKNFKTRYEEADVLLIDDVQYLQGKKQTLDIVFQIFNKLTSKGKQVVLSADRAPKNIDIDERYKSRFNSGGTFDIQPPEIETKLGIVKSFIEEYITNEGKTGFTIPNDIQMYIAEISSSNIRELKSAVTKVIYQMTFFNQPNLKLDDVRILLENHFSGGTSKRLNVADIQKEVESFFKVSHADLVGKKRTRNIIYARQIAIFLCRQMLDLPFNDIGKKFNRDHSTVMYSVTNVEEKMKESRELREEIEAIKQIIREI